MQGGDEYYKQTQAKVLAQLGSSANGLSEDEANSRLKQLKNNQPLKPPLVKTSDWWPKSLITRLALLSIGAIIAVYFDQLGVAISLVLALAGISFFGGIYTKSSEDNSLPSKLRYPFLSKVIRDQKLRRIRTTNLAPGDIIYLNSGDFVPADGRILKVNRCIARETIFDAQLINQLKTSHALSDYAAPDKQTNMIFLGSQIVSGEVYAVITNLGPTSRLAQLFNARQSGGQTYFSKRLTRRQKQIDLWSLVGLVILTIGSYQAGLKTESIIQLGALFLIASSMLDWYISQTIISTRRVHGLTGQLVKTQNLNSLELIANCKTLVCDFKSAFISSAPKLTSLYIGKTKYTFDGQPFSQDQADKLKLPYTIARLLGDSVYDSDYSLLRSSLATLPFGSYVYREGLADNFVGLSGGSWSSPSQIITAASATIETMLGYCDSIWDHDHVRPLTKNDRLRLLDLARQKPLSKAIAYAAHEAPSALTLLGILVFESSPDPVASKYLSSLKKGQINLILASDESSKRTKQLLGSYDLKADDYLLLNQNDLTKIDDQQLKVALNRPLVVLNNVSLESIERTIKIAKDSGHLTLSSDRLEQPQLIAAANVVVALRGSISARYADFIANNVTLGSLKSIIKESRLSQFQLAVARSFTNISLLASLMLVGFISLATIFKSSGILISPLLLIYVLGVASIPLLVSIGWQFTPAQLMNRSPGALSKRVASISHQVIVALVIAGLTSASAYLFLTINHISIRHLAPGSLVFDQALTVAAITFGLCLITHSVAAYIADTAGQAGRLLKSRSGLMGLIVSILALVSLTFYPPLMELVGSASLSSNANWIILGSLATFIVFIVLLELDEKQTKQAILKLRRSKLSRGRQA